jgi:predicted ATPase
MFLPSVDGTPRRDIHHYEVAEIDPQTKAEILDDHPNGEIVGAIARHFFPYSIAVRFDEAERRALRISDLIYSLRAVPKFRTDYFNLTVPQAAIDLIEKALRADATFGEDRRTAEILAGIRASKTAGELTEFLQSIRRLLSRPSARSFNLASLQEVQPAIHKALATSFPSKIEVALQRPNVIGEAAVRAREYFQRYVQYLGPLRDEPKPLYPLEALANPSDVGYRGEHTAAVLDLNRYRRISYVPARSFQGESVSSSTESVPLHKAAEDWLSYMGVVEGVRTGDKGKIGHELQVKTPGIEKFHDLTNVGVGVSQVLPIVVMALLASPGSLLIFEQPELHLHPKVQARLADFFVSLALVHKQCVLETHSEYLIHRLRRRIAEAPGDDLARTSKLYFIERVGGLTSCRPVDITQYGAILDWPAEFFDQAQDEGERILAAATAKRVAQRKMEGREAL